MLTKIAEANSRQKVFGSVLMRDLSMNLASHSIKPFAIKASIIFVELDLAA
jgi:hypothetical protein